MAHVDQMTASIAFWPDDGPQYEWQPAVSAAQ